MPTRLKKKKITAIGATFLNTLILLSLAISLSGVQIQKALSAPVSLTTNYALLVNPLTGTNGQYGAPYGGGNTFPGADAPFGMLQWSPDTVSPLPGGYAYNDQRIKGFSLTHLSGAGCNTYEDIPFMPYTKTVTTSPAITPLQYISTFSHKNEMADAGYYKVKLNNGVTTELTTTQRSGVARFTYPMGQRATLLINLSGSINGVFNTSATIRGNTLSGFVSSGNFCAKKLRYTLYFFARFNQPFASYGTWHNGTVSPGQTAVTNTHSGVYLTFNPTLATVISASVGISFVSVANALANLRSENPSGDFNTVRVQAMQTWNTFLREIRISGGTPTQISTFYTAMYHTLLYPSVFSDTNGQYIGFDNKTHSLPSGHTQYANFSGWDIYRSEAQLLAFLVPRQASDMAQSMINDYVQSGKLPKWSLANGELYDMIGDPADAILADIYAFGGTNFDTSTALTAMVQEATQPNPVRPGLNYLLSLGYLPLNGIYPCCDFYGSISASLEYNTADFALGAFAQTLGNLPDYQEFINRAQDWKNLVNPEDKYIEPRYLNGTFQQHYDLDSGNGWAEGDAAQYTWMVPFNLSSLFQALGGNAAVISRLNRFFTQFNGGPGSPYAFLGNEPTIETPWEYDYAGAPYRTQSVVRTIENTLFTAGPRGLPGNDDLGELSSWYVWAALGMFPETPGTANLVLSSPLFPTITIERQSGQVITISAPNASASVYAVQHLTVNGVTSDSPWLPPAFITANGSLNYILSNKANISWGSSLSNAPPSYGTITTRRIHFLTTLQTL